MGEGQSACRFVLCFRKNWGERYAAASVKPCKNCPTDSVSAPQKSLHSVNLPQTEASLSLSDYVFTLRSTNFVFPQVLRMQNLPRSATPLSLLNAVFIVCRPSYYSTVSELRFSQVLRMQNLQRTAPPLSLLSAVFPVRRPPYCSTVSKLRFSRVLRMQNLQRTATPLSLSNALFTVRRLL